MIGVLGPYTAIKAFGMAHTALKMAICIAIDSAPARDYLCPRADHILKLALHLEADLYSYYCVPSPKAIILMSCYEDRFSSHPPPFAPLCCMIELQLPTL